MTPDPHSPPQWGTPIDYQNPYGAPRRPPSTIVLGVIGILYALYLTACVGIGLIFIGASDTFLDMMQQGGGMSPEDRAQLEQQFNQGAWPIIYNVMMILVGLVCWVGAIGSLVGREIGRRALIAFAAAFLALMVLGFAVEAVRGFPGMKAQMGPNAPQIPVAALVAISAGCGLVFMAYPICVLWFYTRPAIKAWFRRDDPAAPPGNYLPGR